MNLSTLNFTEYIDQFYRNNKNLLNNFYPGLNLFTLKDFFNDLRKEFYFLSYSDFFNAPYLKGTNPTLDLSFEKLLQGIPFAYIINSKYFYNSLLRISNDTLIPRFETELIVEAALKEIETILLTDTSKKKISIFDIGTGSGAISIALLKELSNNYFANLIKTSKKIINIILTDISPFALSIAKSNLFLNKYHFLTSLNCSLILSDLLNSIPLQQNSVDLILSNPPYLRDPDDKISLHQQVALFEPNLALIIPEKNYQEWYSKFLQKAYSFLCPKGVFIMEGHEVTLPEIFLLNKTNFKNCIILNDLNNKPRFLKITKE